MIKIGLLSCLLLFITQSSYSASLLNFPENPSKSTDRAADVDTIFYELFTRKNPTTPQILRLDDLDALNQSNFNPNIPTKIYSHGWTGSASAGYMIRDGYMQSDIEYNFIAMDWSQMATGPLPHPTDYPFIVEVQVPKAGQNAGLFVDFLVEKGGLPLRAVHLLGHSLGSHVVGWAGATVTTGNISRITGLDPAGPFFSLNDTETRLDTTDADFVDVIHTDSGSLTDGQLTFIEAIGHIDFYPNGGIDQPGCDPLSQCDHQRVKDYYAESINNPTGFRALLCDTFDDFQSGLCADNGVQFMGDPTPSTARGVYYLATNVKSPFALG